MQEAKCLNSIAWQTLTDPDLVRLTQNGEYEAFGELVSRYQSRIYRLARRLTDSREDAEDVLQEAFIRAFRALGGFKGESRFSTWLYRITVNFAAMQRRSKRSNVDSIDEAIHTEDGEIKREIRDTADDPLATVIAKETGRHLDLAISSLSATNREVFVLRHLEGMSTEETGEVLNISLSAVKSRLHRSRLALQRRLTALATEEPRAICNA